MVLTNDGKVLFQSTNHKPIGELPKGNWLVKVHPEMGFYLDRTNDFKLPAKIYGNSTELAEYYLKAYNAWDSNLGILLNGLKGTGKSLLAKQICVMSELPVIMITESYGGADFISFLSKIDQPAIILMDEFEKVYKGNLMDKEPQEKILSILDGIFPSKFMFLLTTNATENLSEFLMNRPSRIHYREEYGSLPINIIEEIALDTLEDKSKVEQIKHIAQYLGEITMDIITRVIMDINLRPDIDPRAVIERMNIEPKNTRMDAQVYIDGQKVDASLTGDNPLVGQYVRFDWYGELVSQYDMEDKKAEVDAKKQRDAEKGRPASQGYICDNYLEFKFSEAKEAGNLSVEMKGYNIEVTYEPSEESKKLKEGYLMRSYRIVFSPKRPKTQWRWF
jgi:hypothetical protein